MPDFKRRICWDPQVAAKTVPTEAVHPSDAVFLATHTPFLIRKQGREGFLSERQLLDEFLNTSDNYGVVLAPVIGESGIGKSHIVRWVYANMPEDPNRIVIYLRKVETSLPDVIDRLLTGQQGPEFDQIRSQVNRLGEGITEEQLRRRLLFELREALLTAEPKNPLEKALVGPGKLKDLLGDPFFEDRLLHPEGLLARRAAHAIRGATEGDGETPLTFTVDDLPLVLGETERLEDASVSTRRLFQQLQSKPNLQRAAVDLLNRHIDTAVMKATELGVGNVQRLFLKMRESLAGKEIILLVEDFALIQGVERDLLSAITEAGVVGGERKFATVRTLMAVTSGYYQGLTQTIATRVQAQHLVYELDAGWSDHDNQEASLSDFLARYLNAARLGSAFLEERLVMGLGDVPNACEDCEWQQQCHEAFGVSPEGYGLYPFNESAAIRAIRASADPSKPDQINPRRVLSRVIRHALIDEASSLLEGEFPSTSFEASLDNRQSMRELPNSLKSLLEENRPNDYARLRLLLEYWGGVPEQLVNVPRGITTAFDIKPLDEGLVSGAPAAPETPKSPRGHKVNGAQDIPPSLQHNMDELDRWASGGQISQGVASTIRSIVHRGILTEIEWTEPVMKQPSQAILAKGFPNNALSVSIEGARESIAKGSDPAVRFDRSATNAEFFKALLKWDKGIVTSMAPAVARLNYIATSSAAEARTRVLGHMEVGDAALLSAMQVLIAGAAVAGLLPRGKSVAEWATAALSTRDPETIQSNEWKGAAWVKCVKDHLSARPALIQALTSALGCAQGSGAVNTLDGVRLHQLVANVMRINIFLPSERPSWAMEAYKPLVQCERLLQEQMECLRARISEVRSFVPHGTSFKETVVAVEGAANIGAPTGLVQTDLPIVKAANARALTYDWSSFEAVEKELDRIDQGVGLQAMAGIGRVETEEAAQILEYLRSSRAWIQVGRQLAASQESESESTVEEELKALVGKWRGLLKQPGGGQ